MKQIACLLFFVCSLIQLACAQDDFSCPQVDCPGRCGAFEDLNHDGFCDHGQLSHPAQDAAAATAAPAEDKQVKKTEKQTKPETKQEPAQPAPISQDDETEEVTTSACQAEETTSPEEQPVSYHLISLTLGSTLLYLLSLLLSKRGRISKNTHRKCWNVVLLISFLVSGLLGLLLVFYINYNYYPACYQWVKVLHVEFGIVLAMVSIFHILWHIPYFKNFLKHQA